MQGGDDYEPVKGDMKTVQPTIEDSDAKMEDLRKFDPPQSFDKKPVRESLESGNSKASALDSRRMHT